MTAPATPDRASRFGPYGEPAVVFDYGDLGAGKSIDKVKAFPNALFLVPPGGLKSAVSVLGFMPPNIRKVRTLYDCMNVIAQEFLAADGASRYPAVGIDDATIVCDDTLIAMKEMGIGSTRSGNDEPRLRYLELATLLKGLRAQLTSVGVHVLLNWHERKPTEHKGEHFPGGPETGSKSQTKTIAAIGDLVVRARLEQARVPWTSYYECKPGDLSYTYKDRFDLVGKRAPMNTGEILRQAGYWVPRLNGLEWMDEIAGQIADDVLQQTGGAVPSGAHRSGTLGRWASHLLNQKVAVPFVRWVVQDGLDRAEIIAARHVKSMTGMGVVVGADGQFAAGASGMAGGLIP